MTKVVQATLALQVIQGYLEAKATREFQVFLVFRVNKEREGSQGFLQRDLRVTGVRRENPENQVHSTYALLVGFFPIFCLHT